MALRRVFSQDDDFKEGMFARQIAVMKGQAWNVVETLKHSDHGPLELTRRTRVCVWDDLVDVPVAIPMRAPSTDMHRRQAMNYDNEDEEMDISAANSSQPKQDHDLLGLGSSSNDLPNPNRFELSNGRTDGRATDSIGSPATFNDGDLPRQTMDGAYARSLDGWPDLPARPNKNQHRKHGGSLSFRVPHINTFGSDDLEGDLGYAAAEGMEGNQRKVIVERLEAVKSKNPVFTWC